MRSFCDNMMCLTRARAGSAIEEGSDRHTVAALLDKFDRKTSDSDWITALAGERDWVIISGDLRFQERRRTRAAWLESRLTHSSFRIALRSYRTDAGQWAPSATIAWRQGGVSYTETVSSPGLQVFDTQQEADAKALAFARLAITRKVSL